MSDKINFFTALLGLFSAILVFRGNKQQSFVVQKNDPFLGLKKTFNTVGSISLVFILYFGYMILIMSFPGIMNLAMNIGNKKEIMDTSESVVEYDYSQLETNNQIAFRAAQLISSSNEREKQYDIIISESLYSNEFDLVVLILNSYTNIRSKEKKLDEVLSFFIKNEKYIYALKVSEGYQGRKKDEAMKMIIDKLYTLKNEQEVTSDISINNEINISEGEIE